jgi:DNA-binding transcriptional MerR regulator
VTTAVISVKKQLFGMRKIEKKFYKIGEVAEMLQIPASTLRFWEKEFTVIKPKRNSRNTRFYTMEDIENIRIVHYLVKEQGLKLDAAEQQIRQNRKNVSKKHEVISRLREMREDLMKLSDALDAIS